MSGLRLFFFWFFRGLLWLLVGAALLMGVLRLWDSWNVHRDPMTARYNALLEDYWLSMKNTDLSAYPSLKESFEEETSKEPLRWEELPPLTRKIMVKLWEVQGRI